MATPMQSSVENVPGGGSRAAPAGAPTRELERSLIAPVLNKTELVRLPGLAVLVDRALAANGKLPDGGAASEWIALDPTLVARVLEATAGEGEARESVEFRSIESRLAALGPELTKSLLVQAARSALGAERHALTTRELGGYWMHSVRCAFLSRALAERCAYRSVDEAYLVGLLHDLGSFALLTAVPKTFRSLVKDQAGADALGIPEHAGRLGTIHAQIGAALLERLQLPFYATDAVLLHHTPWAELEGTHPLVRIVRCAEALSQPRAPLEQLKAVCELLGIRPRDISDAERTAADAMNDVLRKLGLSRPEPSVAAPGQSAAVVDMQRLSDTLVMRFVEETRTPQAAEPPSAPKFEEIAAAGGWEDALPSVRGTVASLFGQLARESARLEAYALLRSAHDLQSAVSAILPLAGVVTGLRRAALFVAAEDRADWPGWVVDAGGATRFDLDLATGVSRSVVARAVREAQSVSSSAEGGTRLLAGMDLQIARILGAEEIAALPLLGEESDCRGVMVFGTTAPRASRLAEWLPFLGDLASLVAGANGAQVPTAKAEDPAERLRSATRRLVHEVRNPLSVLKTYLAIAKTRLGESEDLAKELDIASQEVERVARLLDAIGEAGSGVPQHPAATDINRTIKDLLLVYGDALFGSKGISFSTVLDERLPPITCDPEGLKQVLLNLLKNASEAVASGGQVLVGTSDRVNYEGELMAEVSVADNGPGIAPEAMAGIFAAPGGAVRPGGRGLGLRTSLEIVKVMNGHLVCRSRPDSGTTFSILLPRKADESPRSADPVARDRDSSPSPAAQSSQQCDPSPLPTAQSPRDGDSHPPFNLDFTG
jgi:signal transduction histidine kinase/HD-like signal output (HDOD) protein